jgi:hypothetical protein
VENEKLAELEALLVELENESPFPPSKIPEEPEYLREIIEAWGKGLDRDS